MSEDKYKTALAVKQWQDRIQVNVAERMDVQYKQETELQILEIILTNCPTPSLIYERHLSITYLLWLYYLDQYYHNNDNVELIHMGPKGNQHWHTIIHYCMKHDLLTVDPNRIIRSIEPVIPETDRPILNGFLDYPFIFSRVNLPTTLQDDEDSMDAEELNPNEFYRDDQGRLVMKNPNEAKFNLDQTQLRWSLPESMCIHAPDADSVQLLDFLHETLPHHNLEFIFKRVANVMDTYRIFLFDSDRMVLSDFVAYHGRQTSIYPIIPHLNYFTQPNLFEQWIIDHLTIHTSATLVQLLIRLAGFMRIKNPTTKKYPFIFFIAASSDRQFGRMTKQWYMNTPLYSFLKTIDDWCQYNKASVPTILLTQIKKIYNIIEDTRFDVFTKQVRPPLRLHLSDSDDEKTEELILPKKSLIGVLPDTPLPPLSKEEILKSSKIVSSLFEELHPKTSQPWAGFFFSLDHPILAYHIPLNVSGTPIDTNQNRVMKRYNQIIIGKNTQGYRNFRIQIPIDKRLEQEDITPFPTTPRANIMISSQKIWKEIVRHWRIRLHYWDPPSSTLLSKEKTQEMEYLMSSSSSSSSSENEVNGETNILKYEQLMHDIQKQEFINLETINSIQLALHALSLVDSGWTNDTSHQEELYKTLESMVDNLVEM